MSDLEDLVFAALDRLAALESRYERTFRFGRVLDDADVDVSDPTKPRARIHIDNDDDGNPVKSPWVAYATVAGARNQHSAPSKDQQFLLIAPDGEHEAGVLIPYGHSSLVPSPSTDPTDFVDGTGKTDKRFKDGKDRTAVGEKSEHLIIDKKQRITVDQLSDLIIKHGNQAFKLKDDALEPTADIENYS